MGAVQEASLGDISVATPGKKLVVVVVDVSVAGSLLLALNDATMLVPVDKVYVIEGTVERLFFQNTDPNNTVTVEFTATD